MLILRVERKMPEKEEEEDVRYIYTQKHARDY